MSVNRRRRGYTPESEDCSRNVRPRLDIGGPELNVASFTARTPDSDEATPRSAVHESNQIDSHTDFRLEALLHTDSKHTLYKRSTKELVSTCHADILGNEALEPLLNHLRAKGASEEKVTEAEEKLEQAWSDKLANNLAHTVIHPTSLTHFLRGLLDYGQQVFGDVFNEDVHKNLVPELNAWARAVDEARRRAKSTSIATPPESSAVAGLGISPSGKGLPGDSHNFDPPAGKTYQDHEESPSVAIDSWIVPPTSAKSQPLVNCAPLFEPKSASAANSPSLPESKPHTAQPENGTPGLRHNSSAVNVSPQHDEPSTSHAQPVSHTQDTTSEKQLRRASSVPPAPPRNNDAGHEPVAHDQTPIKIESSAQPSLTGRITLPTGKPATQPGFDNTFEPSRAVFVSLRLNFKDLSSQEHDLGFAICDLLRERNAVRSMRPRGQYWIVELQTPQLAQKVIGRKIRVDGKHATIDKYRVLGEQRYRTFFATVPTSLAPLLEMQAIQAIAWATRGQNHLTFSLQSQTQSTAKDTKWILSCDRPPDMVDFRWIAVEIRLEREGYAEPFIAHFEPVKPSPTCLVCRSPHKAVFCRYIEHVPPPADCKVPRYSLAVPDAVA